MASMSSGQDLVTDWNRLRNGWSALGLMAGVGLLSACGGGGSASSTPAATVVAPLITTQPAAQTVSVGDPATLTVVAAGLAPLSYTWLFNGVTAGVNSPTLTLTSAHTADPGSYPVYVTVSNTAGSVTSQVAILTVISAPTITTQSSMQSVTVGDPVTLRVVAAGPAPLSYQWYSGTTSGSVTTLIPGATSDVYAPSTASAGTTYYAVTVANITGRSVTGNPVAVSVSLTPVAPIITTDPTSTSVAPGTPAQFTVVATGSGTLHYAWSFNGAPTGFDSPALVLPWFLVPGTYPVFVRVSNAAGSATSHTATLTVLPWGTAPELSGVSEF
jgi:hypothetical protein